MYNVSHLTFIIDNFIVFLMGFDSYTTSPQQLHNTPSHGVDLTHWAPPHVRRYCAVVVVML
jgi:hypothetical protein